MNHKGTIVIETKNLFLRPFEEKDIEFSFQNWTSDDKMTEFLRWQTHKTINITENIINEWILKYKNKDFYQWAIVLKGIDEPIGTISVVNMDEKTNTVSIGYCIGNRWWKQGITTEAFSSIIPFLFDDVKVKRIEARCDPNNQNSGKVMEKCGLLFEGTLRKADINNKGIVDVSIYALLY